MKSQGFWKCFRACLLLCVGFGAHAVFAQERIVVLKRKMLDENFRLHSLDVDRTGAFYFGSLEEIVKLGPNGRRVFRIGAKEHGLKRFDDFRVAPSGDLIVVGAVMDPSSSPEKTRVLVFSPDGKVLRSFDVLGVVGERVEPGENGEIFLLGLKQTDSSPISVIYRFGSTGEVQTTFEVKAHGAGLPASRNNRWFIVTDRGLLLLDPLELGLVLHRLSPRGQKLETRTFSLVATRGVAPAREHGKPFSAKLDYFSSLGADRFILAEVAASDRWERRTVGEATALYRPFAYTVYVASWDGSVRPIVVSPSLGLLRAVGRDGFLYFVRTITRAGKTRTEIVKAALK